MPNVFRDSVENPAELDKYPLEGEQEMQEPEESIDLDGDVKVDFAMWSAWLEAADGDCAKALMRNATDRQGSDMRGSVNADTAWELCCRDLGRQYSVTYISSGDLAQLLVWLLDVHLPVSMKEHLYLDMDVELMQRGKTCQTEDDELRVRARWLRLHIHAELDRVRTKRSEVYQDLPVELEVMTAVADVTATSITEETEKEAKEVLAILNEDAPVPCDFDTSSEQAQKPALYDADEMLYEQNDDEWYDDAENGVLASIIHTLVAKGEKEGAVAMQVYADSGVAPDSSTLQNIVSVLVAKEDSRGAAYVQRLLEGDAIDSGPSREPPRSAPSISHWWNRHNLMGQSTIRTRNPFGYLQPFRLSSRTSQATRTAAS